MIAPAVALALALATPQQCPIPKQAMMVMETAAPNITQSSLAIFDLGDASQACAIDLPGGPSPVIAVASNGTIYAAIQPGKATEYTTDAGHLAVFAPNGRLLHRVYSGMEGIQSISLDARGRLLVEAGSGMVVNGAIVNGRTTLTMYDASSLQQLRAFSLDEHFIDYALSSDGRYLALCYEFGRNAGHVDLIDPSTGTLIRHMNVPAERAMFEGDTLWIWSQTGISSIDLPDGAVRPSTRRELWEGNGVVDGVEYTQVDGPFLMPGQGEMTTTFKRRRLSDDTTLPPIVARGIATRIAIVKPDPALAAATPGPEIALAVFPSPAMLATTLGSHTAGIEFDDTVSGRHYAYLGDLTRIDAPKDQQMTLVDCKDGVELVADTLLKTYRVIPMDPLPLVTPEPPKVDPDLQRVARRYPQPTVEAKAIDRAHRHSPLATSAYAIDLSMRVPGVPTAMEMLSEREYAVLGASYPSCATRNFDREPSDVQPGRRFELEDPVAFLTALQQGGTRIDVPTPPPGSILVYAESTQPNQPRTTAVNIMNVQTIGADALSRFALPSGYTQEPGPNY